MNYLMKFIKQFVRNTMLLVKSAVSYFCFWWTLKIDEAVCRTRKTQRHEDHDKKIMKINRHKKKVMCRIKILQFWNSIHQTTFNSKNIWKLMKWVKKHSHFFSELLIIFFLQTETEKIMQIATSFENKTKLLWKWFFLSELQIDFNDMKNYCHSFEIELI